MANAHLLSFPRPCTRVHTPAPVPSPTALHTAVDLDCVQVEAKQCIKRILRRLERWELPHLRELAARLATELEEMTTRAVAAESARHNAEVTADMWCYTAQDLIQNAPEGTSIGLTQDGQVFVLQGGAS